MSQVNTAVDLTTIEDPKEFMRGSSKLLAAIVDTVNGNLEFEKNFNGQLVGVSINTTNTDVYVPHRLNRIATGYIVIRQNTNAGIFDGATAWTTGGIYVRAGSSAVVAQLLIF
jgi:hypothetical protein